MIKILNIITRLNIGGASIHVVEISQMFTSENYTSTVLYGDVEANESDMLYLAKEYSFPMINIPTMGRSINLWQDLKLIPKVYRIIRRIQPEIVHTHTAKAGLVGRIAARMAGVPVILHTFHGNNFRGYFGRLMSWISVQLERMLAGISTRIIAISEQQKEELLRFKICKPDKLRVIHLGFEFGKISYDESHQGLFKANFGIAPQHKLVGFVGRLTQIKNPWLFIKIAQMVLKTRDDVVFAFVGDGELADALKDEVMSLGLQQRIIFTGFVKDLKPLYADMDALLLTSINEGTPVAIIEAMANRVPVLATRVGGVPNLVADGESGWLFDTDDAEGFAQTLLKVLDDANDYSAVTHKAWEDISARYSANRLKTELEELFSELGL